MYEDEDIKVLLGLVLAEVTATDEEVRFVTAGTGRTFLLYHEQDCCESVTVDEIDGPLDLLVGSPIIQAEEVSGEPPVVTREYEPESETWTFYKLATAKGHVTIRFYGTSNGYYSERVYFSEVR
jgi:hypothetical protein